jgi:hypothetical protein
VGPRRDRVRENDQRFLEPASRPGPAPDRCAIWIGMSGAAGRTSSKKTRASARP